MVRINICMYCMYIYIYIYIHIHIHIQIHIRIRTSIFLLNLCMGMAQPMNWASWASQKSPRHGLRRSLPVALELLEVRHLWDLYNVLIICRWSFTPIEPASNKLPKQCGYGHLWNPSLVREARLWVAEISGLRCRPRGKARQSPSLGACRGDHCCFRSFLYVHIIHVRIYQLSTSPGWSHHTTPFPSIIRGFSVSLVGAHFGPLSDSVPAESWIPLGALGP